MRLLPLLLVFACGGPPPAPPPAPVPPAPPAAAVVGPDGPEAIAIPEFVVGTDADAVARGKLVFEAKGCGGCHAFGSKLTGPDFNGLAERRTDKWIAKMILHPDEMTKQDPAAKKLLGETMVQMPNQGVEPGQVGDLIAWLKAAH